MVVDATGTLRYYYISSSSSLLSSSSDHANYHLVLRSFTCIPNTHGVSLSPHTGINSRRRSFTNEAKCFRYQVERQFLCMYLCVIEWFYSAKMRQTFFIQVYMLVCMYACMYDDDDVPMSKDDLYRAQTCTR